jgi:hypothetical protein
MLSLNYSHSTALKTHSAFLLDLYRYDAEDTAAPLLFTDKAERSQLFGTMDKKIVDSLAEKPYARESHAFGVSLASFDAEPNLRDEFDVLSLSVDPEGNVCAHPLVDNTPAGCLPYITV